jgi:large subunit ribosomal protein L24
MAKVKLRKGDKVVVITGRDKGKSGEVKRVLPAQNRVVVEGIGVVKRHTKPSAGNPGGIVDKELSIEVSNVAYVDPKTGQPTRIGYRTLQDGRKVRFAKRSGEIIDA